MDKQFHIYILTIGYRDDYSLVGLVESVVELPDNAAEIAWDVLREIEKAETEVHDELLTIYLLGKGLKKEYVEAFMYGDLFRGLFRDNLDEGYKVNNEIHKFENEWRKEEGKAFENMSFRWTCDFDAIRLEIFNRIWGTTAVDFKELNGDYD